MSSGSRCFSSLIWSAPPDGAKDGLDCGVREGGVHVARPFFRGGVHLAGGGVLDRHKPEDLADAPQALLVDRGEHRRQPRRGREDGGAVAGAGLFRVGETAIAGCQCGASCTWARTATVA
jgi:hypothetical protein